MLIIIIIITIIIVIVISVQTEFCWGSYKKSFNANENSAERALIVIAIKIVWFLLFHRMLAAHWEGNPNVIFYKAKGTGGADEMAGSLEDGEVMYGLG